MTDLSRYFALGFKCIPVSVSFKKDVNGQLKKKPVFGSPYSGVEHTPDTFKARWTALEKLGYPVNGVGIITGSRYSGISVLDLDEYKVPGVIEKVKGLVPDIDKAPSVNTPSGGRHYYFKANFQVRSTADSESGMDSRGEGGLIFAPPSRNKKGIYTWVNPITTIEALPEFPPVLIGMMFGMVNAIPHKKSEKICRKTTLDEVNTMLMAMSGQRWQYDDWVRIINSLWTEFSFEDTIDMLRKWLPEEHYGEYEKKYQSRFNGDAKNGVTLGTFRYYFSQAMDYSISGRKSVPVAPSRPVFSPPTVTPPKIIVVPEAPKAVLEPVIAKPVVLPKNDGLGGAREYLRYLLQFHKTPAYRII